MPEASIRLELFPPRDMRRQTAGHADLKDESATLKDSSRKWKEMETA